MAKLAKIIFIVSVALIFIAIETSCFAYPITNYEFENHSEIPLNNY